MRGLLPLEHGIVKKVLCVVAVGFMSALVAPLVGAHDLEAPVHQVQHIQEQTSELLIEEDEEAEDELVEHRYKSYERQLFQKQLSALQSK